MSNPNRLVVALCLTSVFAITALAGETPAGYCSPPVPGEIDSPPCATTQLATDDPTKPSERPAPTEAVVVTATIDAALGTLLTFF
jgi:hypothetical protein